MKRLAFGLISMLALAGCPEDEQQQQLDDSRATWEALRDSLHGTYGYHRNSYSIGSYVATTRFQVVDNRVVERSFKAEDEVEFPPWTERGDQLGSHSWHTPVRTVDELYDECERTVLTLDRHQHDVVLEFDADGILSRCTYEVEKDCIDGCTAGVHLTLDLVHAQ